MKAPMTAFWTTNFQDFWEQLLRRLCIALPLYRAAFLHCRLPKRRLRLCDEKEEGEGKFLFLCSLFEYNFRFMCFLD